MIRLRSFTPADTEAFWRLAFSDPDAEWHQLNAPYFHDPVPSLTQFKTDWEPSWCADPWIQLIIVDDQVCGLVTAHYEDGKLARWLEVGIVIYAADRWGQHIGSRALALWLTQLFKATSLPHLGLTTWSGNPRMMRLATGLGLQEEARIRQVRYWQGHYFDSVKYGILRSEWEAQH